MKRIFALFLAGALALSLTACGRKEPPAESGSGSVSTPDVSEPEGTGGESTPEEDHSAPAVLADYAPENVPEELIAFREEPTDYDQLLEFRAQTDVLGFCFFELDYPEDGGPETEGRALFTYDSLKKGEKLYIVTSFPGDMPSRGISFDLGGQHEAYALSTSGEDGTLILSPMGGVVPGW